MFLTVVVKMDSMVSIALSTTVGDRGTPTTSTTPTTVASSVTPATVTTPPGNTDRSPPTPSGPQGSSTDHGNMQLQPDGKYPTL